MLKKTKIVCTLGPSSNTPEIIEKMIKAGMNVARFNFSHGSHEEHKQRIDMVRAVSQKLGIPVALLLDTKGPEITLETKHQLGNIISFKSSPCNLLLKKKMLQHILTTHTDKNQNKSCT